MFFLLLFLFEYTQFFRGSWCVCNRHNETPVVRASGRELSYILLAGIIMCYSVTFALVLRPSDITCGIQRYVMHATESHSIFCCCCCVSGTIYLLQNWPCQLIQWLWNNKYQDVSINARHTWDDSWTAGYINFHQHILRFSYFVFFSQRWFQLQNISSVHNRYHMYTHSQSYPFACKMKNAVALPMTQYVMRSIVDSCSHQILCFMHIWHGKAMALCAIHFALRG